MATDELITEIKLLANKCDESDAQRSVKSVPHSLLGAMYAGAQMDLMRHTAQFSQSQIRKLTANRN